MTTAELYRTTWSRLSALVAATGVGVAFLVWSCTDVLGALAYFALSTGVVVVLAGATADAATPRRLTPGAGAALALHVGAGIVCLAAAVAAAPGLALALVLVMGATSPWCLGRLLADPAVPAWRRAAPTEPLLPELDPASARAASTGELRRAWRASHSALVSAGDARARLVVVEHRQVLLDELARRRQGALGCWLGEGDDVADHRRHLGIPPEQGRTDAP